MNSFDQANYYAQRASDFIGPLVAGLVKRFELDPDDLPTRLALVDALTRAYQLGRRDGTTEVIAQLHESGIDIECTLDIDVPTGPLGGFGH
jgi:hypothetical protein